MSACLRIATSNDAEFAFQVERETMRGYAIETWGRWREAESREHAVANAAAGQTQIIEVDGVRIGVLRVERTGSCIDLHQIYILPEFQRRGVGSGLLRELMREAQSSRLPLKLRVLKVNPAVHFYRRLGFAEVNTSAEHVYMEYAG